MKTTPLSAGSFYHVYNRGNNGETIFKEEKNYIFFLQRFKKYLANDVEVYAYCLMPNHFHFLIRVKDGVDEDKLMLAFRTFFMSYAKAINKAYERTGSLFQNQFKRKLVEEEEYFTKLVLYIHYNPVNAGLEDSLEEWHYSSYLACTSKGDTLIQRKTVLDWFGGVEGYQLAHVSYMGDFEP